MIQRSVATGLIGGVAGGALLLPPVIYLFLLPLLPRVLDLTQADTTRVVALLLMSSLASLVLFATPLAAAYRAQPRRWQDGAWAGLLAAVVAGSAVFAVNVLPTRAASATLGIMRGLQPADGVATLALGTAVNRLFADLIIRPVGLLVETLVLVAVLGALLGAIAALALLRRHAAPATPRVPADTQPQDVEPSPGLLDVLDRADARQHFWGAADEGTRVGLLVGAICGIIVVVVLFTAVYVGATAGASGQLQVIVAPRFDSVVRVLGGLAVPATIAVLLLVGGLPVMLLRHPTSRVRSRVQAATTSGITTALVAYLGLSAIAHWWLSAAVLSQRWQQTYGPTADWATPRILAFSPVELVTTAALIYVVPAVLLAAWLLAWTVWTALQGVGYGLLLPVFLRRPVDRAARLEAKLVREARGPLPSLYAVAYSDDSPLEVIAHLALGLRRRHAELARLVAAYHLLTSQPDRAEEALAAAGEVLLAHPDWRWQAEILALHRVLLGGLQARAISSIAAIPAVPDEQTTSLPPALSGLGSVLSGIIRELNKLDRVATASAKLIFLNNTLEELHRAGRSSGVKRQAGLLPERGAARRVLSSWESLVLEAISELQGRARLTAELQAHKVSYAPDLPIAIRVANAGLNVAESVCVIVEPGEGYRHSGERAGRERAIDLLPPGEERVVEFTIQPAQAPNGGARRIRLQWRVVYDDAVDARKELSFADVIEFAEDERPFQRIFPIPYVTGTPLRTGHLFVGREDVFAFVREHLLGTYQNNVIVLHGQRRTGKTSVLYRLKELFAETHVAVLVDMQGKAARGTADFLYALADDIAYVLESAGIAVQLPERAEFEASPEFQFQARFLRGVYGGLGDRSLLLMFDEFEELQKRVEDGRLEPEIFAFLRNLMQHEPRLSFLFAGTHQLEELGAGYWSMLFNIAAYKRITFLSPAEVRTLVTQPVAPFGMEYDPAALERILQAAAGHPYFTQVICHELVAHHNETRRNYLTASDVDLVVERIVERGEAHFKYIWSESSPQQRSVLLALAYLLEDQEHAAESSVCAALEKAGRELPAGEITAALRDLEARDILMRTTSAGGIGAPDLYRFRIDLIRRWIYRARPAS